MPSTAYPRQRVPVNNDPNDPASWPQNNYINTNLMPLAHKYIYVSADIIQLFFLIQQRFFFLHIIHECHSTNCWEIFSLYNLDNAYKDNAGNVIFL